ncbi:hypothetical protein [Streptomyces sp. NPDC000888]
MLSDPEYRKRAGEIQSQYAEYSPFDLIAGIVEQAWRAGTRLLVDAQIHDAFVEVVRRPAGRDVGCHILRFLA